PGLALGALCFFMREPPRHHAPAPPPAPEPGVSPAPAPEGGAAAAAGQPPAPSYWSVLRELRGIRSFVLCTAGMTASTFVLGGVATVMQLYLFEREARFTLDANAVR